MLMNPYESVQIIINPHEPLGILSNNYEFPVTCAGSCVLCHVCCVLCPVSNVLLDSRWIPVAELFGIPCEGPWGSHESFGGPEESSRGSLGIACGSKVKTLAYHRFQ